ncbi:MAG: c-type cytochrome [Campylobacterales bacterium]|nr:c-type cytochrome [Campylobacterales bacterium]
MQKALMIVLIVITLLNADENNASLTQKTNDLLDSIGNSTKEIANELFDNNSTEIDAQALYKKCAGCHGSDGKTAALTKSSIIAGSDKNETLHTLQEYQKGELDKTGMGRLMYTQVDGLKLEELEALAEYIAKMEK